MGIPWITLGALCPLLDILTHIRHNGFPHFYGFLLNPPKIITAPVHRSLQSFLTSGADEDHKYGIITGIASALIYLHSEGIVHCHLTPSEILLDRENRPKIIGLQYSFRASPASQCPNCLFQPEQHLYAAPPQTEISLHTAAADIYSFGLIILAIMTNGENVPTGNGNAYVRWEPHAPYLQAWSTLIDRCCTTNHQQRLTASEILDYLGRFELRRNLAFTDSYDTFLGKRVFTYDGILGIEPIETTLASLFA
jgi:serine/threonine protein kinase